MLGLCIAWSQWKGDVARGCGWRCEEENAGDVDGGHTQPLQVSTLG
jgi:hypothetical protein